MAGAPVIDDTCRHLTPPVLSRICRSTASVQYTDSGETGSCRSARLVAVSGQKKVITFTGSTPDSDGDGPCRGAADRLTTPHRLDDKRDIADSGQQVKQRTLDLPTGQQNAQTNHEPATIFIPEGFSPNGHGVNDRLVIRYVPDGVCVRLDIYNRWGNHVYYRETLKMTGRVPPMKEWV